MNKILSLIIFCSLFMVNKGYSQLFGYTSIQYEMSFATGDMGEFISAPSFRGAVFEYRGPVGENFLVGVDIGWNVFYERKDLATYTVGTESLSGVQYRYQNQVPLLLSADYVISTDKPLKPYVGLGVGTVYSERSTDMNLYRLEQNPWQFAIKPEVGMWYETTSNTSFKVAAKYRTGLKAGDLETQGYFTLSAGFAFLL